MEHFLQSWGYVALFVLTFAQGICIPFPSEVTMSVSGYLASTGKLNLAAAIALGTFGEVLGATAAYWIARIGGRALIARYGRYLLLTSADVDRAHRWFERRGEWSVMVGRCVPLVRSFIPLPAGVAAMSPWRFIVLSAAGSLIWLGSLAGVGYALGSSWSKITHGFKTAGIILAVVAVVLIALAIVHRWRHVRSERDKVAISE